MAMALNWGLILAIFAILLVVFLAVGTVAIIVAVVLIVKKKKKSQQEVPVDDMQNPINKVTEE